MPKEAKKRRSRSGSAAGPRRRPDRYHVYFVGMEQVQGRKRPSVVKSGTLAQIATWAKDKGLKFRPDTTLAGGYWNEPSGAASYVPYPVGLTFPV